MIYVVNVNAFLVDEKILPCYVGRTWKASYNAQDFSVLGNPFTIGRDGTRSEVIEAYKDWLNTALAEKNPTIRDAMNRLYKLACEQDIALLCHCAPAACHGEVLQKKLLELLPVSANTQEQIERELVLQGYKRLPDGRIQLVKPMYRPIGKTEYIPTPGIKLLWDPYIIEDTSEKALKKMLNVK